MKHLVLWVCLTITANIFAQKNVDPTPEDISLAKKLRAVYDKDDVALLVSTEDITFDIDRDNNVIVYNYVEETLMNINHRADIQKYVFYDSESEIEDFSLKYRNNRKTNFRVQDEFYGSDDLFFNDYRVKFMTIDFPVQGYSYNYELKKKYNDVKYFTTLYFHDEYPTLKKKIVVKVPNWLELDIKEFNFEGFNVKKTVADNPEGDGKIYTYSINDINAMSREKASPGPSYLYPHLLFVAKSYSVNGNKTELFNTTADLYKWYKSLTDSMDENPAALRKKVEELTANAKTDDEKIKNIYYWVQDNIRYIAFEDGLAGFRPDASQNVFQKRYGDCKGMANLTRQMLKEAGFDARLTWIGTKRIAYDYSTPSLSVDNHMICTLFKDGKKYFLDGTEKYNSFGEYAERIQGKEVMIEDGDNFILEKVPLEPATANSEVYNTTLHINGESLVGSVASNLKGESRASFLYGYNNIKNNKKEDALQYYITNGDKNVSVSDIKTSDLANRDITLTLNYNAEIKNRVSSFDDEMYVDLDYLEELSSLDFKERKTDYEFSYKKDYTSNIILELPEGYSVSRMPAGYKISNDIYSMDVAYEQKENKIIYTKHFTVKRGRLKKADFGTWNQSITSLKNLYNDQITLTKK